MTNRLESVSARRLACARCGTEFTCDPSGACWCFEETVRLPLPSEGQESAFQDCLCRDCLHAFAAITAAR
ncbi:cysteine-rich CWC family protein [Bradyrhizobium sp. HKCCYLS1011]|uniref:cysteine-rich CWC family protein n=1 Tax=Bradyrhizobium sp. HKCCYLS1011 TaxID=3420733 RepID=UPI003EBE1C48